MSEQTWERDRYGLTLRLAMGVVLCVGWVEEVGGPRRWRWTLEYEGYGGRASRMATGEPCESEAAACVAGLVAASDLGKLITACAEGEARRAKQAAQDADDAALVAAHGAVLWSLTTPTRPDGPTYRRAQVVGHPIVVEEFASGRVKWWVEPDYYGHEYTWDAPDVATAMQRAVATALRDPCRRWKVTITGGKMCRLGTVEVWARTADGAVYRGACALGTMNMMAHYAEGRADEVGG
jgi:hypothetical protein